METTPFECPLCETSALHRTGAMEYHCTRMHGAFRLRGTLDAATGFFSAWLEHVTTGLRFDVGPFAVPEWERLARCEEGSGPGID